MGAVSTVPDNKAQKFKSYFDGVNYLTVPTLSMVLNNGEVVITLENPGRLASITTQPSKQHVAVVNEGISRSGTVNDSKFPYISPPVRSYMCIITTPSHAELKYIRGKILPMLKREFTLKRLNKGAFIGCAQIAQTPASKRSLAMDFLSNKMPQSVPVFKPAKYTTANSKKEYEIPKSTIIDYFLDDETEDSLSEASPSHNSSEPSTSGLCLESPDFATGEALNTFSIFEPSSPDIFSPSSIEGPVDATFEEPSTDWLQRITVFRGAPPPGGLIKRYSIQIGADFYVEQTEKALILSKDGHFITIIVRNDGFDINAGIDEGQSLISRILDLDELFTELRVSKDEYGLNASTRSRDIPGQAEVERDFFSIGENVRFAIDFMSRAVAQRAISF